MGFCFFEALEHSGFGSQGFEQWMFCMLSMHLDDMHAIFLKRTCKRMREIVDKCYTGHSLELNIPRCKTWGTIQQYEYLEKNGSWCGWFKKYGALDVYCMPLENILWMYHHFLVFQEDIVEAAIDSNDTQTLEYVLREKWITLEQHPEHCIDLFICVEEIECFQLACRYFPLDSADTQRIFLNNLDWCRAFRNRHFLGWVLMHQHLEFWNFGAIVRRSKLQESVTIQTLLQGCSGNPDERQKELLVARLHFLSDAHPLHRSQFTYHNMLHSDTVECASLGTSITQFIPFKDCKCNKPENHRLKKRHKCNT